MRWLSTVTAMVLCLPAVTLADQAAVMFVMDASGSMWGQVDGRHKIEVAREVMSQVVTDLPDEVSAGLVAYGHNRKGDCADIEIVAPVGTDRQAIVSSVKNLNALGSTPLAETVKRAAESFREYEGPASVVVVSDGKESCDGDPCAAARAAVDAGVNLRIHVVGFDVSDEESQQLRCIAKEGKGKYLSASNAAELTGALAEVRKEVVAQTPPPVPTPMPTPAPQAQKPLEGVLPRGGHGHGDAVPIEPGEYVMTWELPAQKYEYYSLRLRPGQLLRIAGPSGGKLFNERNEEVYTAVLVRELLWLVNSRAEDYVFGYAIGNRVNQVESGSTVSISVEDAFDAGSTTDAGDDFRDALAVEPGKYEGFLVGGARTHTNFGPHNTFGDDKDDFYRLASVQAGDEIKVKVAPPTDVTVGVRIYDQDRVEVAAKESANHGAIARTSWTASEEQEEVFVRITPLSPGETVEVTSYDLDIRVESAGD